LQRESGREVLEGGVRIQINEHEVAVTGNELVLDGKTVLGL
jgi:hypothetical protein